MPISHSNINQKFLTVPPARLKLVTKDRPDRIEIQFPVGPQSLSYSGEARKYSELSRPFQKPLLVSEHDQLRMVQFSALLADMESGGTGTIQDYITNLNIIANESSICTLSYGLDALPFYVVITSISTDITRRDGNGDPVRALVRLELREAEILDPRLVKFKAVVAYETPDTEDPPDEPEDDTELEPEQQAQPSTVESGASANQNYNVIEHEDGTFEITRIETLEDGDS